MSGMDRVLVGGVCYSFMGQILKLKISLCKRERG